MASGWRGTCEHRPIGEARRTMIANQEILNDYRETVAERQFRARIEVMRLPYLRLCITRHCNAACSFCHNEGQQVGSRGLATLTTAASLTTADFRYIARFFRRHFSRVKFTGGEPTTVANLDDIIAVFRLEGYSCSLTSNGFLLDDEMQRRLRIAGLEAVNVSLHTTDEVEHEAAFGVHGQLHGVVTNLHCLRRNFPGQAKINFMAMPGQNVPNQLLPMTELSASAGIPVSYLAPVTERSYRRPLSIAVVDYLTRHLGIASVETVSKAFYETQVITFKNGGVWEIDDFRRAGYRGAAFDNGYCRTCRRREKCTEGAYTLRILQDGSAKPCLIRNDNVVRFKEGAYVFKG